VGPTWVRAKGYHPQVIVTDLRQDYGPLIGLVFPKARHHECIFHTLQNVQDNFKEVFGADYAETHPQAATLKQDIYHIFDAQTKRTAQKPYDVLETMFSNQSETLGVIQFLRGACPAFPLGDEFAELRKEAPETGLAGSIRCYSLGWTLRVRPICRD